MPNHTDEQTNIINAPLDRHIKVVAGPGTGKSRTMLYRVLHLIKSGISPTKILISMFNESATTEFKKKLSSILEDEQTPRVSTFHSIGYKLCDFFCKKEVLPNFKLITEGPLQKTLAKQALISCVDEIYVSKCNPKSNPVIEDFISFIDLVKSTTQTSAEVFSKVNYPKTLSPFIEAFNVFETLRKQKALRFFSDLIYDPVMLLLESCEARKLVENLIDHVIVDEYQDINEISQELVKIIAGSRAHVTVVGDDDQTIYLFRGSDPNYLISLFDQDFPDAMYYKLTRTFRYGHPIALAASNLIHQNEGRLAKICLADNNNPASIIEIHPEIQNSNSANFDISDSVLLRPIKAWKESGRDYSEIAILLRLFSSSPPIELALIKAGIPYKLDGGNPLFKSYEIASLITLLEISTGDFFNLKKNTMKNIRQRLKQVFYMPKTFVKAEVMDQLVLEITKNPEDIVAITDRISVKLHQSLQSQLDRKARGIKDIQEENSFTPHERLDNYLEYTGCFSQIKKGSRNRNEAEKQTKLINAFLSFCKPFDTTEELLAKIAKHKPLDKSSFNDGILITSTHRSKGLEFPMVLMPNLSECTFPCINDDEDEENVDIETERRLFFVGMTRAIEKLILSPPMDEELFENIKARKSTVPFDVPGDEERASRFLYETNLRPSIEISNALYKGDSYCDLPIKHNKELINKYLVGAGSQIRL